MGELKLKQRYVQLRIKKFGKRGTLPALVEDDPPTLRDML